VCYQNNEGRIFHPGSSSLHIWVFVYYHSRYILYKDTIVDLSRSNMYAWEHSLCSSCFIIAANFEREIYPQHSQTVIDYAEIETKFYQLESRCSEKQLYFFSFWGFYHYWEWLGKYGCCLGCAGNTDLMEYEKWNWVGVYPNHWQQCSWINLSAFWVV